MDSVTQKNNFLSMTGIDQVEENTLAIANVNTAVSSVNSTIANFVQNEVPFFVKKNGFDQIYNVTGFLPIQRKHNDWNLEGSITWDPIVFNPAYPNELGQLIKAGDVDKRYQMTFDCNKGLDVNGPITLKDNALKIANINGLTQQITDIQNSIKVGTDPQIVNSIAETQATVRVIQATIMEMETALKTKIIETQTQVSKIQADLDVVESALDVLVKDALRVAYEGVSFIKAGSISGPEIKDGAISAAKVADGAITVSKIADGAISGSKLKPDIIISTTSKINAAQITVVNEQLLSFQIHAVKNGILLSGEMVFSPCYNFTNAKKMCWYTLPCSITITKATIMFNSLANVSGTMKFDFMVKDSNGSMSLPTKTNSFSYDLLKPTMIPSSYTQLVTFAKPVSISSGTLLSVKYSGSPTNDWSVIFHGFQW